MLGASEHQQQYILAAAVLHHGQGLCRGHYTSVCKLNSQQWIHWDDSSHRLISEAEAFVMCVRCAAHVCLRDCIWELLFFEFFCSFFCFSCEEICTFLLMI
jgi:hypothetical protein